MTILGIDVGMSGALSFYDGEELLVYDMPVFIVSSGKKNKKVIDNKRFLSIVESDIPSHAYIERVWAQPGNGASQAFTYGFGCGQIEMAIASLNIPYTYVTPQAWKKNMGVPVIKCTRQKKEASRMRASQLLPEFAHNWDLKKHDGRAESALIALYGYQKQKGQ